ncbi:MAG: hypothetical protein HXX16_08795 [Bacteroidales bacterium]|nr:hypothetical protein [Bacteroidales bacterium]
MTLVVGSHFGDSIGIVCDTRVTLSQENGIKKYYDAFQKVYYNNPFIVGFAGAIDAATKIWIPFYKEHFINKLSEPKEILLKKSVDTEWIFSTLKAQYEYSIEKNIISPNSRFIIILAAENFIELKKTGVKNENNNFINAGNMSIENFTNFFSKSDTMNANHRKLIAISFPEKEIREANPGEKIIIGSGDYIDKFMLNETVLLLPELTADARIAVKIGSLMTSIKTFSEIANDPSFNGITIGMGFQDGGFEACYSLFNSFPSDAIDIENYNWQSTNKIESTMGELCNYKIGFDPDSYWAFILDFKNSRKLHFWTIFDLYYKRETKLFINLPRLDSLMV